MKSKHIFFSIALFFGNGAFCTMWKNSVQPDRPQMTIWHLHIACWIS